MKEVNVTFNFYIGSSERICVKAMPPKAMKEAQPHGPSEKGSDGASKISTGPSRAPFWCEDFKGF
jgi:hypothetical protein